MRRRLWVYFLITASGFVGGLALVLLTLYEPTEQLTTEKLRLARRKWETAAIRNYDAEYRMHGSTYEVAVRDGIVVELTADGAPAATSDWGAYSMDGLFDTLAQELDMHRNRGDAGGPSDQRIIMRVRFHDRLGYIERYLRSAGGYGRGVTIEMLSLAPLETAESGP